MHKHVTTNLPMSIYQLPTTFTNVVSKLLSDVNTYKIINKLVNNIFCLLKV